MNFDKLVSLILGRRLVWKLIDSVAGVDPFSAGTEFRLHNLTSLKSIPVLKE